MPNKKKTPLAKAKEKAWNAFSLFIRTRDCIKTCNSLDEGSCVTCNHIYPRIGNGCLQAGHFLAGRTNSVLFDERGVHGQCMGCNVHKHGAVHEYWLFMEQAYGRELIDKLIRNKNIIIKYKTYDYEQIAKEYIQKTEDLIRAFKSM